MPDFGFSCVANFNEGSKGKGRDGRMTRTPEYRSNEQRMNDGVPICLPTWMYLQDCTTSMIVTEEAAGKSTTNAFQDGGGSFMHLRRARHMEQMGRPAVTVGHDVIG